MLLGQILIKESFCTEKEVLAALDKQHSGDERFLGEILMDDGKISEKQLKAALQVQFGIYKKGFFKPKWIRIWKNFKKALFQ
ncbi:hypothetical protein KAH81_08850 [bacterium]|nr:hypothetical protein [bacterium]